MVEFFLVILTFIGFIWLHREPEKNRDNNKYLNRRPNSFEFYENFNSREERIKYLNYFFEYYDYEIVYPEKHKKTSEPGTIEFLEETFLHGSDKSHSYHDEYVQIMKFYYINKMDMISEVRQTEYYKKVKDKSEFEKHHRQIGNYIIEEY